YTVGHSTRTLEELAGMLKAHGVAAVADVRLIPRSRRVPWFNADVLPGELAKLGLAYLPFGQLGGRRRAAKDSPNTGWRNESFRGYADFMQTEAFNEGIEQLMAAAEKRATTIMCAEAVPWRCHRSLIGDALLVRGWEVLDIMSTSKVQPHVLTKFAKVEGLKISYPPEESLFKGSL
ncbi:MAG TPA: DUF488 domain-containing protein, partial [Tepidisphaeraceae bacterium]